jgi:hypothetical protein
MNQKKRKSNTNDETGDKQRGNKFDWLKEYQWQKGQSGNPAGRPKTKTLKEFARDFLASMSEEARIEYLKTVDPRVIWEMAEGKPKQDMDVTTDGKPMILRLHE